jgi:hypothetical protein
MTEIIFKGDRTQLESMLRDRIVGRKIVRTEHDGAELILDDGHRLYLYMSDQDCCATAHGEWVLQPDRLDAVITDITITFDAERSGDNGDGTTNYVTIAILHNQNPVALADCYADDGNGGYYFSTLALRVSHIIGTSKHDFTAHVVSA